MKLRITTDPPSRMHSLQPEALRLQVSTISITAMIRTLRHWNVAVSWALKVSVDSDPAWSIALTWLVMGLGQIDTKSSAVSKHILAEQSQSPSPPSRFLHVPYVSLCLFYSFLVFPYVFMCSMEISTVSFSISCLSVFSCFLLRSSKDATTSKALADDRKLATYCAWRKPPDLGNHM